MNPLKTVVVGLGMGKGHAKVLSQNPAFQLVAACDLKKDLLEEFSKNYPGTKTYSDFTELLEKEKPEVVVIATPNNFHAPLTIQAARSGVKGVYCEKPMAVNMKEAREMVRVCQENKVALAVNHQRRNAPVFRKMKELIDSGAIGKTVLILGSNAGDLLSDGTHFVDSARYLAGDSEVQWVFGQIYRNKPDVAPGGKNPGRRYGHVVESGGFGVFEFANGIRAEVHSGDLRMNNRWYQHYEILGTEGRLIRENDTNNLFIQDKNGGPRLVEITEAPETTWARCFAAFLASIYHGTPHHLDGNSGLKDMEIVMAIYESARTHQRLELPLSQDRFPLEIMVEQNLL